MNITARECDAKHAAIDRVLSRIEQKVDRLNTWWLRLSGGFAAVLIIIELISKWKEVF